MSITEQQIAILASKRLKMDGRGLLPLMTFIPNALNNLARDTAADLMRRPYLETNALATSADITNSGSDYYADLSALLNDPQIMLDNLKWGTIFYSPETLDFAAGDITLDPVSEIELDGNSYQTGLRVRIAPVGGDSSLPSELEEDTDYYIIVRPNSKVRFATSYADAVAGTPFVALTDTGSGTNAVIPYEKFVAQWLGSPNQGSLTPCIPLDFAYIWLQGNKLYTTKTTGSFLFNVPFIPTLDTLPSALESDLLDQVVNIAMTAGFEEKSPAQK